MKYETKIEDGIEVRHIHAPKWKVLSTNLFSSKPNNKYTVHTEAGVWDITYNNNLLESVKRREHKFFE